MEAAREQEVLRLQRRLPDPCLQNVPGGLRDLVSATLAAAVADGLGLDVPPPMPRAAEGAAEPEVTASAKLSLMAFPGDGGIRTRKIAILVAHGAVGASVAAVQAAVLDAGAVPKLVAPRLGRVKTTDGTELNADATFENSPGVLFDAMVLCDGEEANTVLAQLGQAQEFVASQYRHCKTILALGSSEAVLPVMGVQTALPSGEPDPGVIVGDASVDDAVARFIEATGKHRHPARETDPPLV